MAAQSVCKQSFISHIQFQINRNPNPSSLSIGFSLKPPHSNLRTTWQGINFLSLKSLNPKPKHRMIVASLPTAKPERVDSDEKLPKWSWRAIKSFAMGELEARKLRYSTTGTEALLMGVLIEGTDFASKFLRKNGFSFSKVREESLKLLGKGDMYYFSPEHPQLTEDAQLALDWAIDCKLKSSDSGEITTSHIVLGVWSRVESPGHKIMSALGFNDEKAKELEALITKPGFVDE